MKLNRKVKTLLVAILASASCLSLITATATTVQAQQHYDRRADDSRARRHVVAQREERPPAPPRPPEPESRRPEPRPPDPESRPEPRPPLRQHDERE
jgi:hypothetical protein